MVKIAPQPKHLQPRCIGLDEAAEYAGVSRRFIQREISAGRLRSVKLGRRTLIDRFDLDQFIELRKGAQCPSS